jgi:hypothetical protein
MPAAGVPTLWQRSIAISRRRSTWVWPLALLATQPKWLGDVSKVQLKPLSHVVANCGGAKARGLLAFAAVLADVDEEIATEKIAAKKERILHIGAVVQCDEHFLADTLPFERQPHLVTMIVISAR